MLNKYLTMELPATLEKEMNFVKKHMKRHARKGFYFLAFEKSSGNFVGYADLHEMHEQYRKANIGLWIAVGKQRKGFGEEIVRALFDFGFSKLKLNRIGYALNSKNKASEGLIKKLGGKFEGTLRDFIIKHGKPFDDKVYSILASEWKRKKGKKK